MVGSFPGTYSPRAIHAAMAQEVAVRHPNFKAALPWFQTLAVEGQVAQELLGPAALVHGTL